MINDQTQSLQDADTFLNEQLSAGAAYWPRKRQHRHADTTAEQPFRVFILGNLVIDLQIFLRGSLKTIADAIESGDEKVRDEWTARSRIGGFAAWAARSARKLGARIWLSSVIPVPTPRLFGAFFDEVDADTTFLTVDPGPVPASIELVGRDGHLLIPRNGLAVVEPTVPADIRQRFDCVLVNPGGPAVRGVVLRKLRDAKCPKGRMPAVAIAARSDWTAQDLALVRDRQFFVFFNRREVVQTADRISGNGRINVEDAAQVIKDAIGKSNLVVTLGRNGAMMLNNRPEAYFSRAQAVERESTGASDMLTAFTGMRRAQGREEEASLDAGVASVAEELLSR